MSVEYPVLPGMYWRAVIFIPPASIFLTDNTRLLKESDSFENVSFTPDACDYLRKAGVPSGGY